METSGHGALKENHWLDDGAYLMVRALFLPIYCPSHHEICPTKQPYRYFMHKACIYLLEIIKSVRFVFASYIWSNKICFELQYHITAESVMSYLLLQNCSNISIPVMGIVPPSWNNSKGNVQNNLLYRHSPSCLFVITRHHSFMGIPNDMGVLFLQVKLLNKLAAARILNPNVGSKVLTDLVEGLEEASVTVEIRLKIDQNHADLKGGYVPFQEKLYYQLSNTTQLSL